ncbi:hypothetical protein ACFQVD_36425 [Streptosporangium amethystogenes subsp. fukuiense]|uniref:Uncharacterized protein n=1 Tax=Streptosporangium amethystogenes subsp. fukuiense TaxID=698418 RepID=A0ABW2TDG3_9ACTN
MDIAISVLGAPDIGAEIRSLYRWLQRDDDLPSTTVRLAPAPPAPDEMGVVSDVLFVALGAGGAGGAGAVLARSLSVWIQHRTSDLKLTIRGKEGTVQLDGKRIKDPLAIIEALHKAAGE